MAFEVRVECPKCDNLSLKGRYDPVCYINDEKGVYYCQRCKATGKVEELNVEAIKVIDVGIRPVFDSNCLARLTPLNDTSVRYLCKRFPGIEPAELNKFNLLYSPERHAIAIPNYRNGKLMGVKYRSIDAKSYTSEAGSQSGGYWLTAPNRDKLLIVEGELDAIAGRLLGFEGSILALQTNKISQEAIEESSKYRHVFVALDNDEPGFEGLEQLRRIFAHSVPVTYPEGVKDLNELLQTKGLKYGREYIQIQTATELERATVGLSQSLDELVSYLSDTRNTRGDSTGFPAIDELFGGGLRPQELTLIVAFAKTGKTSFLNNFIHNLAYSGKKVAVASFEMDPARTLFPSILSIAGQTNLRSISNKHKLRECVELLEQECPYLQNIITLKKFGYTPWSEVEEWAKLVKKQFNIDYLIIDHVGFCVSKMTDAEENQTLAKNIKKLTLTLGIHILCVVQAPKTKDGLSIQTAYGGMAWSQNCDSFLILERDKEDENLLKVRLEAARYPGANPSYTPIHLFYNRETGSLNE